MLIGNLLTRSTIFTCFCSAQTSKLQQAFDQIFLQHIANIAVLLFFKFSCNCFCQFRVFFCADFDEGFSDFHDNFQKNKIKIFRMLAKFVYNFRNLSEKVDR